MKFQCINGWTKEKMKQAIKDKNTGLSYTPGKPQCLYRQNNGNACFVGVFIPDEKYDPDMDRFGGYNDAKRVIELYSLIPYMPLEVEGMSQLQRVHDSMAGKFDITKEELHSLAFNWIDKNVID